MKMLQDNRICEATREYERYARYQGSSRTVPNWKKKQDEAEKWIINF
jgi:hypothetical protein